MTHSTKQIFHILEKNTVLRVSIILSFLLLCCIWIPTAFAGNVITNGTKLKVLAGTSSVSVSDFVIKSGATINNAGLLILKKGLNNENSAPNPVGSGTVKLTGTAIQTITGQNTIQDLIINNASGVSIGGNTNVNGTLTLTNGLVTLGDNNLLLGSSASISGTPSSAKMIVATAAGELRKNFPTGFTGSFTFPVGDNTGTPEYSPVTLSFTTGTFVTGNYVGINLRNLKYPDPLITVNYLKRYWTISQSGITGLSCCAVYQYVSADVVGDENIILCTKIVPIPVVTYGPANPVTDQLAATAIASFGTYTGGSQSSGVSLTGPTQVCANSTGNIYTTDAGKTNYQWIVSAGGTITAGGTATDNTATITWNTAGPQTVSVNYNGSSNPTVLNVTVNPLPVPTITGTASTCQGTTGVIYSTESRMTGYTWTISAGGTITNGAGTNAITVTWNITGSNFVKVNYQNSSGCYAQTATTKSVYVNAIPVPILNGPSTECLNNSATYYTDAGQTNYVWSASEGGIITEGFGSTNNTVMVKWISPGPQTVSVSYTNSNGCTAATPTVKNVTVLGPTLSGPTDVCKLSIHIYTTEPGMGNTYIWAVTGGQKIAGGGASNNTCTIKWIATGSRHVMVTYTTGNCTSTATLPVTVNSSTPTITGPSSLCGNAEGNFSTDEGMTDYVWTVSPGGMIVGPSNTSTIAVAWNVAGDQWVKVDYTSPSCEIIPTTFHVPVWDLPVPTISGPAEPICIDSPSNTYTTEPGQKDYIWTVSPGNTITMGGEITDNTITITWNATGAQWVSVNYTDQYLCSATSPTVFDVTVNPLPVPAITGPQSVSLYSTNQYSTAALMTNYEWSVSSGGNVTSGGGATDSYVTILWSVAGSQSVSVNYSNDNGCSASEPTTLPVQVIPLPIIPGFDPISNNESDNLTGTFNSDLLTEFIVYPVPNDGKFAISITSLKQDNYSINIYNSLGAEVYNLKNLTISGFHKQQVDISSVSEGVYMVILRNADNYAAKRVLIKK